MRIGVAWMFRTDPRGNRLLDYYVSMLKDGSEYYVSIRGCPDVANSLLLGMAGDGVARSDKEFDHARFTHCFRFDGPYTTVHRDFFDLLKRELTFTAVAGLDLAMALDLHSVPPTDENPNWTRSEGGALLHAAKYQGDKSAGRQVADRLAAIVQEHPVYNRASRIIGVPGNQFNFGEKLARAVAHRVDKPLVMAACLAEKHGAAKAGHESYELEPYAVDSGTLGETVVVVDDTYRSGVTMRSVAEAARRAGASTVVGLCATRTMRTS